MGPGRQWIEALPAVATLARGSRKAKSKKTVPRKVDERFYKTKLCKAFQEGHCELGSSCSFAHGPLQLRKNKITRSGGGGGGIDVDDDVDDVDDVDDDDVDDDDGFDDMDTMAQTESFQEMIHRTNPELWKMIQEMKLQGAQEQRRRQQMRRLALAFGMD
jgi:hypothetical protein